MRQHKATDQRTLESAIKHRKMAEDLLSQYSEIQSKVADLKTKIDAEASKSTWDTDYEASLEMGEYDPSESVLPGPHKGSKRRVFRSALSHRQGGDEYLETIQEYTLAFDVALATMDAGAGDVTAVNFADLKVDLLDPDEAQFGQHKRSLRQIMVSALSHKALADELLDDLVQAQKDFNAAMDAADAKPDA